MKLWESRYVRGLVFGVVLFLFLAAFPGSGAQARGRTLDGFIDYYDHLLEQGLDRIGRLLRSTGRERSEIEAVWDEVNAKYISVFNRIGHVEFESLVQAERNQSKVSRAREWGEALAQFTDDLQKAGDVLAWQRQVNREIARLEHDIEGGPGRLQGYSRSLRNEGRRLETIRLELRDGRLSSSELQRRLDELRRARVDAENVSASIVRAIRYLHEDLSLDSEMDRRIVQILGEWSGMRDRHPRIGRQFSDAPPGWVSLARSHWERLEKAREDFDRVYAPLLEGRLFADVPFFRGRRYEELVQPVLALEVELRTAIAATVQREKSEEELRRELALDQELTRKERERMRDLSRSVSPSRMRELQIASARAAGGAARVRELQIVMSRAERGSEEYRRASEEARLIDDFKHPEQLAVAREIEAFKELERRVAAEIATMREEHTARRRRLGLAPEDFFR